jgi:hypothetical protein
VDLRGRGLDVRVAHERTQGELMRSGQEDVWDRALDLFEEREVQVGLRTHEELWGA